MERYCVDALKRMIARKRGSSKTNRFTSNVLNKWLKSCAIMFVFLVDVVNFFGQSLPKKVVTFGHSKVLGVFFGFR